MINLQSVGKNKGLQGNEKPNREGAKTPRYAKKFDKK
jgi:hypothetical protein